MTDTCRIPWFCVPATRIVIFLRGYWHSEREKWHEQTLYNSWSNAFDPKEKFEWKLSKRCYYFLEPPPKSGPKVAHFYCMKAYRDWPQIQDPQILTVGNPIESKDMRLLGQLFFGVRGSKSFVDTLLLRLNPSDQKHSTRNCIKLADSIFLVLNVDSRGEKKLLGKVWHRIKEFYTDRTFRGRISWNLLFSAL